MSPRPAIDVVVASYRRPESLRRCLQALREQDVLPREVVVVVRGDDSETRAVAEEATPAVRVVSVDVPGVSAALRAGVAATDSEVVAFTDDDARPRRDWLARLSQWFARPDVDAVGGRDVQRDRPADPTKVVGRLAWWGRMTGEHHVGTGAPRDVDVLKGVNLAVRADALALAAPGLLEFAGNDPHNELIVTTWVRRHGGRVVYDPAMIVDHDVAPRFADGRVGAAGETPEVVFAAAANRIASACAADRRRLVTQVPYGLLVGSRASPGLLRAATALVRREPLVAGRLPESLRGQLRGAWRVMTWRGSPVMTCVELRQSRPRIPV